ncbi:MAG: transcriptional repressor LexA [Candidatus Binatia bacterium]|jgi:repressor LexA|nr:transcriptional repressor LexA [Candidatus Binatia bacterium]
MILTKRQKEVLDYITTYTLRFGYAPTLAEIGRHFGLTSLATVHKHLKNLEDKKLIRKQWNRSRALEIVGDARKKKGVVEVPLLGRVAAGSPIEAVELKDSLAVPEELVQGKNTFLLRVKGDSMIDEQIRDGDLILVQARSSAEKGQTVVALVDGEATVKKFYREVDGRIRLQPANESIQPIVSSAERVEIRGSVVAVIRKY